MRRLWLLFLVVAMSMWLFTGEGNAGEPSGGDVVDVGTESSTALPDLPDLKRTLADLDIQPGEGIPERVPVLPHETVVETSGTDSTLTTSAAETEVVAPAAVPWYMHYLDLAVKGILTLLGTGLVFVMKKWFADSKYKELSNKAIEALEIGWSKAQEEFVVFAKRASLDGKLTKEERAKARGMALDFAFAQAKGPVRELLLAWGKDKAGALLGKITGQKKNNKTLLVPTG